MTHPLLQVKDLAVGFRSEAGYTQALHHISFEVGRGEAVAIVGESGSGKSVTSLSVLQLLPAPPAVFSRGRILFSQDGKHQQDLLHLPEAAMRQVRGNAIAMIFQEPMSSLNPVYTCGEQVMEAIRLHRRVSRAAAKEKTIALFNQVRLPDPAAIFDRYPHQLSGGQKQRVMIAMAISCHPALLIADEPTTALDVTVQKTILLLIKELQQQFNMGVIFITHDLGVVAEVADRVVVMYKGKIVEQGTVKAIFQSPQHPYTRSLLACRPALHTKGERLPVVSDFMEMNAAGEITEKPFHPPKPAAAQVVKDITAGSNKPEAPTLIQVSNLKVWFPGRKTFLGRPVDFVKAVNDISFEVRAGETLGLVGESGCGKTTLGRALLRLVEPTSGEILFRGQHLLHYPPAQLRSMRKNMQIIFQDPYASLNPRLTIGSAIQEPMAVHGMLKNDRTRREKVVDLLEKVDLKADHYHRYPHEFSGGQRQRIVIARALALNPGFVVCDESVSALDVSVQAQVLNLLNDLKKEFGFTAIFISHDLSVVRYISDRIMVMHKGRMEESGDAEQVYHHPQTDYTRQLINAIPKVNVAGV